MIRLPQDTTLRVAIFTAVACSAATATYVLAEIEPAPIMVPVLTFAPLLAVILWLQKDGQRTGICAVLDWGMFAWFAWPVVFAVVRVQVARTPRVAPARRPDRVDLLDVADGLRGCVVGVLVRLAALGNTTNMPLLFSCGTLQQADVQLSTVGRLLDGLRDELRGFEVSLVQIQNPHIVGISGLFAAAVVGSEILRPRYSTLMRASLFSAAVFCVVANVTDSISRILCYVHQESLM